ncbi:AraC-type DNA-binding protein [Xylanibacter ruminicola]|uniref:AraC-type DNA-binding protein n=1 Tax=Xylanibacter ruminicola TaxID=839 RepID=A0A1M7IER0_XYLRU|nr:helix-turn-helix domain-containing protein [Xylanibacter ruminicola]SFB78648.1 AraC-type DNA-binding protein [Xylanibacter ruminicola]SHM39078.1 AraC-type DNA-binding protein [Xylanibacter ruminicola]
MVKAKKQILIQDTEFKKAKNWEGSVCLDDDLLLSDQINKAPMPSEPRKTNFILIGLCTKGKISYRMDTEELVVHAGELLVVSERHVIDGYKCSDDMEGLCIMMSVNFFHEIIKSVHDVSSLFVFARMQPVMKLEADEIATFTEYFQFIKQKISDNHNHFRKDLIRTLMLAMFYDVGNVIYRVKNFDESLLRSEKVFTRFLKMVEENCKRERRVSWYAQQLNITPKYLSTAVKRISGRTAVEWIENYVTMELRVLLKNSTKSIKEITEELNFPNQSFLGKYFKEHVGMTPSAYRKS